MVKERIVSNIENGIVIDHIPAGKGIKVFEMLKGNEYEGRAVILMNALSKKLGRKDVVKIENKLIEKDEVNKIALIAPDATLSIIKDWNVVEKRKVILPDILEGVAKCPNINCITNSGERVTYKLVVVKRNPLKLRCWYCERVFGAEEVL